MCIRDSQLLVPYDMATIYNYKSLWAASTPINGTGQTVALAGTSNIVLTDIATFRSATGLPAKVPTVIITNSDPGTTNLLDDRMENTLDVEWSGAAAPGASIVLVTSSQTSQTTDALYASESYIVNNNVAKIMRDVYKRQVLDCGAIAECSQVAQIEQARHPATLSLLHALPLPVRVLLDHFSPHLNGSEQAQLPEQVVPLHS